MKVLLLTAVLFCQADEARRALDAGNFTEAYALLESEQDATEKARGLAVRIQGDRLRGGHGLLRAARSRRRAECR